ESRLVLLVTVGVGVARPIEPDASPALAVVRRGEEAVDHGFDCFLPISLSPYLPFWTRRGEREIGRRGELASKRVNLLEAGRQAGEVQCQAAQQRNRIGFGRGGEFVLLQLGQDEAIQV